MRDIDCSSSNVSYTYQCYFCNKQDVGETSSSLRIKANDRPFEIKSNHLRSCLLTHLQEYVNESSLPGDHHPSFCDYILIPIEQIRSSGSDWQDLINRLKRETFWIDNLGSLKPTGLKKIY